MKQRIYIQFLDNLEEITKQYRLLLDCVRKEKEHLVKTEVEKLNECSFRKEQILNELAALESVRIGLTDEMAAAAGSEPRLLAIAQKLGGAEGDRLRTIHSSLELLTKRTVEINKANAVYAESALQSVHSAMENIKETLMGQKTYQKKGAYQQGSDKSGHLVSREA